MPLEFLKRKSGESAPSDEAEQSSASIPGMPEEVVAQEYILKLYYAG